MIPLTHKDILLFIGDSITHGGRGMSMDLNHILGHGYAEMVCAQLAADNLKAMPRFVNKGISGDTTQQIISRWQTDVIDLRPTHVSLLVGVNDVHADLALPAEEATAGYLSRVERMLQDTAAALPGVHLILCEPFYADVRNQDAPFENIPHPLCEKPFRFANAVRDESRIREIFFRIRMLQAALPDIAARCGAIYVPLQDLFDRATERVPMSYLIWDNLHPTFVGHRLIADRWLEIVGKHL